MKRQVEIMENPTESASKRINLTEHDTEDQTESIIERVSCHTLISKFHQQECTESLQDLGYADAIFCNNYEDENEHSMLMLAITTENKLVTYPEDFGVYWDQAEETAYEDPFENYSWQDWNNQPVRFEFDQRNWGMRAVFVIKPDGVCFKIISDCEDDAAPKDVVLCDFKVKEVCDYDVDFDYIRCLITSDNQLKVWGNDDNDEDKYFSFPQFDDQEINTVTFHHFGAYAYEGQGVGYTITMANGETFYLQCEDMETFQVHTVNNASE